MAFQILLHNIHKLYIMSMTQDTTRSRERRSSYFAGESALGSSQSTSLAGDAVLSEKLLGFHADGLTSCVKCCLGMREDKNRNWEARS